MTGEGAQGVLIGIAERLVDLFASPSSDLSLLSLASAFLIAAAFLQVRSGRTRRWGVLVRALLPRRWRASRSVRADIGLLLFNLFVGGALLGFAIVSSARVEDVVTSWLGEGSPFTVPRAALAAITTVALYLAYEAMYFLDHYLKHRVRFLWHFHRVHHTADELTPLTNARIHPVDGAIFANFVALGTGTASALVHRLFDAPGGPVLLGHANAIMIAALFLMLHLHHSHVWIPFTGRLGRWILSPAHHQLHHSTNAAHFNRNLGATLAVFDRLAGTLLVPRKEKEQLTFGAGPYAGDPHGVTGLLVTPFVDAAAELRLPRPDLPVPNFVRR